MPSRSRYWRTFRSCFTTSIGKDWKYFKILPSPFFFFFLDLGHKEEGTFYLNGQVVRRGRKSCLINNDLFNPEATYYSHFFGKSLIDVNDFEHSYWLPLRSVLSQFHHTTNHLLLPSNNGLTKPLLSMPQAYFPREKLRITSLSWKRVQQKQSTSFYEKQTAILTFANLVGDLLNSRTTECL